MRELFDEPHNEYHAKRGLYLTSHLLIEAFKSPAELIDNFRMPRGDTTSLYFGRAAHVHLLEPGSFASSYVVGGPVNPKTGKTFGATSNKFKEWAGRQLLPALTAEEGQLIESMTAAVMRDKAAVQLLARGEAELTGRCEIENVPCQVRLDWFTKCNRIVDYKTTSSLATFDVDCEQYGYLIQQSFYRQVVHELTGELCPCYLIACEKSESPTAVVWRLSDDLLDDQAERNRAKIVEVRDLFFRLRNERLKKCQLSEASSKTSPKNESRPRQQSPKQSQPA